MLIRTLKKIMNNNITPKEEYIISPRSSNIKAVDKKIDFRSNVSVINRFSENPAKKKLNSENNTQENEEQNQRIQQLESEKKDILNELKSFYIEVIKMLKLDHVKKIIRKKQ